MVVLARREGSTDFGAVRDLIMERGGRQLVWVPGHYTQRGYQCARLMFRSGSASRWHELKSSSGPRLSLRLADAHTKLVIAGLFEAILPDLRHRIVANYTYYWSED